jgi:hypothetical protein
MMSEFHTSLERIVNPSQRKKKRRGGGREERRKEGRKK